MNVTTPPGTLAGAASIGPAITVVMPVYNDWTSFVQCLDAVDRELAGACRELVIVAVDDGSSDVLDPSSVGSFSTITEVKVVDLVVNLGHQRAIAVGLVEAAATPCDCIIVMDSDGEDRPAHIRALLASFAAAPDSIHVAERTKRLESLGFRIFYYLYKTVFFLSTGKNIAHGNFSLIPASRIGAILHSSNTWNNLAASITRSRVPYVGVPTDRGRRFAGTSKMNFTSLLIHGLSAVSVYLDVFAARILIASVLLVSLLTAASLVVLGLKLFTTLAIPGWTSTVLGLLFVIMMQIVMFAATALFSLLHSRSQSSVVPSVIARGYIRRVYGLFSARPPGRPAPVSAAQEGGRAPGVGSFV